MPELSGYFDVLLFAVLPYVAAALFVLVSVQRYVMRPFTYSSLSSQFLENRDHFWSLVPFHYGIIVVLTGHLIAFLIPQHVLWWNRHPLRLYVLEITALAFGLLALIGLIAALYRRLSRPRVKTVTTANDWVLVLLLLVQIYSGVHIAIFHRWGSSWYAAAMVPYLSSLLKLRPELGPIASMPWMVKVHVAGAFVLIGFFPFTRLAHVLVAPIPYLWRKPQLVRWYGNRHAIRRQTETGERRV